MLRYLLISTVPNRLPTIKLQSTDAMVLVYALVIFRIGPAYLI